MQTTQGSAAARGCCLEEPPRGDSVPLWGPAALEARRQALRAHQERYAEKRDHWIRANAYFYAHIARVLRFIVEPQRRVLDVRCQTGFLLDAVRPARGVGVDISEGMLAIARQKHPAYEFVAADPETLALPERFDYILLQHVCDTVDVLGALKRLQALSEPHTRLVIYTYNHLWEPILQWAERLRIKMPMLEPNWLSEADLKNMLALSGFQCLHTYRAVLFPKWIPLLSELCNRILARLPGLNRLCMINVLVARPTPPPRDPADLTVSVIVPCKDERGNIEPAVQRIPDMGRHTEIIFCDDRSTDGTADEVRRLQALHPKRDIKLVPGPGICKAKNVWTGFEAARGDILMILDADLTVMPEELPFFFQALARGAGEFINGSRLVYPVPALAMKMSNMLGNKAFGLLFSYLLGQPIKDTLCGTKVLWRTDWERIRRLVGSWGIEDRWGDYELLFGAAKLQLAIVDLPVHYQERVFGSTKMVKVFQNGLRMLRMCGAAFWKLKMGY